VVNSKLASNAKDKLQKGRLLCQEVTVQARLAKDPAQDVVWDAARANVKAGWAVHLQQGRAEIVSVQAVEQRSLMLSDSRVIKEAVQSVVRK
jgi:hypothetical protein